MATGSRTSAARSVRPRMRRLAISTITSESVLSSRSRLATGRGTITLGGKTGVLEELKACLTSRRSPVRAGQSPRGEVTPLGRIGPSTGRRGTRTPSVASRTAQFPAARRASQAARSARPSAATPPPPRPCPGRRSPRPQPAPHPHIRRPRVMSPNQLNAYTFGGAGLMVGVRARWRLPISGVASDLTRVEGGRV